MKTLDEAIERAYGNYKECMDNSLRALAMGKGECVVEGLKDKANEELQLAYWLTELKTYRKEEGIRNEY